MKKTKNEFSKGALIFILGIIPSVIFLTVLILMGIGKLKGIKTQDLGETGMLTIIATAVSVWVGLNIYNVVTKQDIEEDIETSVKEKFNEQEIKFKKIQESIIRKKTDNVNNKSEFKTALDKLKNTYAISKLFLKHLQKLDANSEENLDYYGLAYYDVKNIEELLVQCSQSYEENQWEVSINEADKLSELIKEIEEKIDYKKSEFARVYLDTRKGDAIFYQNSSGGRNSTRKVKIENLRACIKCYKEVLNSIENDELSDSEIKAYVLNTIGYTYRLIANEISEGSDDDFQSKFENNMDSLLYEEECLKQYQMRGRYYRNAGLVYEWLYTAIDRIYEVYDDADEKCSNIIENSSLLKYHNDKNEEKSKDAFCKKFYDAAKMYYDKAAQLDKYDFKAFNNQGAIYLQKLDRKYGITPDRTNLIYELGISNNEKEKLEELKETQRKLILAREISPTFEDSRYNYAKAKMYEYLFTKDHEQIERAFEEVNKVFDLNKNNPGAKFVLRNCYEASEQLDKAILVNQNIIPIGDSEKIMLLYIRKKFIIIKNKNGNWSNEKCERVLKEIIENAYGDKKRISEINQILENLLHEFI